MGDLISILFLTIGLAVLAVGIAYEHGHGTRLPMLAGRVLRTVADIIDRPHAPRGTGLTFTFQPGEGLRIRQDNRGCPLWYISDDDYELAFTEADR